MHLLVGCPLSYGREYAHKMRIKVMRREVSETPALV
jgi:hypothetical protein